MIGRLRPALVARVNAAHAESVSIIAHRVGRRDAYMLETMLVI